MHVIDSNQPAVGRRRELDIEPEHQRAAWVRRQSAGWTCPWPPVRQSVTVVENASETALSAARRLVGDGLRPPARTVRARRRATGRGDLLDARIGRLLRIANASGHSLVLGAWGCGAFANDPVRTADAMRRHLEQTAGAFEHISFAITDWSPERRLFSTFAAAFSSGLPSQGSRGRPRG